MNELERSAWTFLKLLNRRYGALTDRASLSLACELRALLAVWPKYDELQRPAPSSLPACGHLDAALAGGMGGAEHSLIIALSELIAALPWGYGYPEKAGGVKLSSLIAFSEIVGPAGLLPSDELRLGLTLIAPATHYPAHAHPAIETYLVISGRALWCKGSDGFTLQPPGAMIFHPSNIAHAMQTEDEPLLAVYSWRGDLTSPSVYI